MHQQNSKPRSVEYHCCSSFAYSVHASQALNALPSTVNFPLSEFILTPYMPVPETNGEEWDRLEAATALDALIELALHGEYNGLDAHKRAIIGLNLRSAAVTVFEVRGCL